MSRSAPFAAVISTLAALAVLTASATASTPKVPFTTGIYTAKTSQKTTFRFKIVAHTPKNNCGSKAGAHCFIALSDPPINETCSDGTSYGSGLFEIPNGNVSSLGYFAYHHDLQGANPLIEFHAHAYGTKVTGSYREKNPAAGGGGVLMCDSATVTFTAKLA